MKQIVKTLVKNYLARHHPEMLDSLLSFRRVQRIKKHKWPQTSFGFKFASLMGNEIDEYEDQEKALLMRYLKESDVLIDVGANCGLYTCMALSLGKYAVAFEPLFQNLDFFYFNLQENNWNKNGNLEVFPLGIGKQPGLVKFRSGSTMSASFIEGWAPKYNDVIEARTQVVPLSTLDIVIGNRFSGKKLIVKVDVEGAEYDVLQGSNLLLSMSPKPVWLIEIFSTQYHPQGFNPHFSQIFELFWSHGYEAQEVNGNLVTRDDVIRWKKDRATLLNSNYVFKSPGRSV